MRSAPVAHTTAQIMAPVAEKDKDGRHSVRPLAMVIRATRTRDKNYKLERRRFLQLVLQRSADVTKVFKYVRVARTLSATGPVWLHARALSRRAQRAAVRRVAGELEQARDAAVRSGQASAEALLPARSA